MQLDAERGAKIILKDDFQIIRVKSDTNNINTNTCGFTRPTSSTYLPVPRQFKSSKRLLTASRASRKEAAQSRDNMAQRAHLGRHWMIAKREAASSDTRLQTLNCRALEVSTRSPAAPAKCEAECGAATSVDTALRYTSKLYQRVLVHHR
jgi:hypothetical protein